MTFLRLLFGYLLQVTPFAVLSFYPFSDQMRFSKRKLWLLTSALILGLAALFAGTGCYLRGILPPTSALFSTVNIVFMLALLPCLLWYLYVVKMAWQKKLFIFSFALSSALMITTISNTISTTLPMPGPYDGLPYRSWSLPILFLSTAVTLPFLFLILNRCYKPMEDGLSPKENTYLTMLSLVLFLILASVFFCIERDDLYHSVLMFLVFALFATVLVIYLIFFKLLSFAHQRLELQREADQTRHLLSLQTEQYRRIRESIESGRRMRHDFRHHLVLIQGLLQKGEIEQTKNYVESCMEHTKQFESVNFCGNRIVNAMVGYCRSLAAAMDIEFSVRAAIPEETAIRDEDLSVLLGNLLENAIEAANRAAKTERYIHLNMICSGKMLAVTVDNGFDGEVQNSGGRYLSTKAQHDGVGLQSIEHIAEKYGGGVEFTHEGKVFHSSVMLGIE